LPILQEALAAGERRALIGANGAGKTTLFNAITGDFPPTAGRVRFFGEDVTTMPPKAAWLRLPRSKRIKAGDQPVSSIVETFLAARMANFSLLNESTQ